MADDLCRKARWSPGGESFDAPALGEHSASDVAVASALTQRLFGLLRLPYLLDFAALLFDFLLLLGNLFLGLLLPCADAVTPKRAKARYAWPMNQICHAEGRAPPAFSARLSFRLG